MTLLATATRFRTPRHTLRLVGLSASTLRRDTPCHARHIKTEPAYPGHIPLNWFENTFLAAGSALMSFTDPRRAGKSYPICFHIYIRHSIDMVAALGETTAGPVLPHLLDNMLASEEGLRILKDRPRVNTGTVDMSMLSSLPENSFGHAYVTWLERCGVTPDTRDPVCPTTLHPLSPTHVSLSHAGALHRRARARICHAAVS